MQSKLSCDQVSMETKSVIWQVIPTNALPWQPVVRLSKKFCLLKNSRKINLANNLHEKYSHVLIVVLSATFGYRAQSILVYSQHCESTRWVLRLLKAFTLGIE